MSAVTKIAVRLARAVLRNPRLKPVARQILARFPGLQGRIRTMMFRSTLAPHAKWSIRPQADGDLSPRSQRMLNELRRAQRERDL